ncbi:MAG: hypothetical protein ACJ8C4_04730 [Gemmataceae bacterium]
MIGLIDHWIPFAIVGGGVGAIAGILIAMWRNKTYGEAPNPDIATFTGVICGIIPGVLIVIGGGGVAGPKLVGGSAFGPPMAGLLIGAILDRWYENRLRRVIARTKANSPNAQ